MARDWSRAALDDLSFHTDLLPAPSSAAAGLVRGQSREYRRQLALGGLCLLTGAMASLLYGWPALMLTVLVGRGPRPTIFWSILGGGALVLSTVAYLVTIREQRHWAENWRNVSDWADPEPWK
ncbi:MAG: hypothetical protein ACXVRE_11870 [Gaiellaceae bacterium]